MNARPELRPAVAGDLPAIRALLVACGLPADDLGPDHLAGFHVAAIGGEVCGVAGVEPAAGAGLLRSVAVRPGARHGGRGRHAGRRAVAALFLIANDEAAAAFFRQGGYVPVARAQVPPALAALPEFTHLCPQHQPCFVKRLGAEITEEPAMKKLEVFDPAMCCSTGVCGVDVDPVLAQFAADLQWVEAKGVAVARHNLGQEPQAFAANPAVLKEMEAGMDRLPILTVDGHIVSTGMYPSRVQLAQKLGIALETADKPHIKAGGCGCAGGKC
jgi:N-acetylglutamate synthase-like GNAT family acetyltransferase